jgi:Big-like domain-containing protein
MDRCLSSNAGARLLGWVPTLAACCALFAGCGHDDDAPPPTPPPTNAAPLARSDRLVLAYMPSFAVTPLANDVDPEGASLTVSIVEAPTVGTATVNANQSVTVAGMPAGFRGVNRFRYRATDPAGAFAEGYVLMFVDVAPFRAMFAKQVDGHPRIAVSDFLGPERLLTTHDPRASTITSFAVTRDGMTLAYTREPLAAPGAQKELCTERTSDEVILGCFQYPAERQIYSYTLSPNGHWLALKFVDNETDGGAPIWLIDTNHPSSANRVEAAGFPASVAPYFSTDSQHLYFSASPRSGLAGLAVYRVEVTQPGSSLRLSAPEDPASIVRSYAVAPDETRLVIEREDDIWLIDTASPGLEHRLSHLLARGESLESVSVNPQLSSIAYSTAVPVGVTGFEFRFFQAEISDNPNPHLVRTVTPAFRVFGGPRLRADAAAMLISYGTYSGNPELVFQRSYEVAADGAIADAYVGEGGASYDLSGNYVWAFRAQSAVFQQAALLSVATRQTGGLSQPITAGTTGMQVVGFSDVSDSDRGALLIQETLNPYLQPPPVSTERRIGLINFSAPQAVLAVSSSPDATLYGLYLVDAAP